MLPSARLVPLPGACACAVRLGRPRDREQPAVLRSWPDPVPQALDEHNLALVGGSDALWPGGVRFHGAAQGPQVVPEVPPSTARFR